MQLSRGPEREATTSNEDFPALRRVATTCSRDMHLFLPSCGALHAKLAGSIPQCRALPVRLTGSPLHYYASINPSKTISLDAERSDESSDSLKQQLIEQPALREWFLFHTIPGSWPLLPPFQSLQTLGIESLSSGILVVPAMAALLDLQIHFDMEFYCSEEDAWDRDCAVLVDFSMLPRLSKLTISHLQLGGLIFHGKSESLKTLEVIQSEGELSDKLSDILREIGVGLEQIIVNDSWGTCRALNVELFSLKKIHLLRSPGFLPFLL
ncbi:unnamed protein product [Aspergillus oryzae]|nr:unnamed protein product [Aspergillus oryzae]